MINNLIRGLLYVIVFVLLQVLFLNNIHFLRIATPFLYLYVILRLPLGESRSGILLFSFFLDCWSTFLGIRRECMPLRRHSPVSAVSR